MNEAITLYDISSRSNLSPVWIIK